MPTMQLRTLGRTGVKVSPLCLGAMMFGAWGNTDHDECIRIIHRALDAGINFIDTADVYANGESEEIVGKALSGGRREHVVLATKVHGSMGEDPNEFGNTRRWITTEVDNSLRRLGTDWIDLYQIHRPELDTDLDETLGALTDLVRAGKIRYFGSSNLSGWQVAHAEWISRTSGFERFVSAQNEYSWLRRGIEQDLVPALVEYGIGLLPYFPLASGLLSGKYRRGEPAPADSRLAAWGREADLTDDTFDVLEALSSFAASRGVELLDVAIGGLAARPAVASVIAGATSREQVVRNVAAGAWQPTADDLEELSEITG